jgi:hypothetical protein
MRYAVLIAVITLGCASVQPPAPPAAPTTMYVRAPIDAAWTAAVQFFADSRVPISTIDKASGLIASKDFGLSADLFKRWADCGTLKDGSPSIKNVDAWMAKGLARAGADFNVFLRPAADSTAIRVNIGIHAEAINPMAYNRLTPVNCVATDAFERELVEYVRVHAKQ